jgi:hypothetical protein
MVFQYRVKGLTGGYQTLALDTVIKIRTFHQRLPVADGRYSYSKVCMFFQPLVKCSAGQLLMNRGRGEKLGQWSVPVYTRIFFVWKGLSCTFEQ